MIIKKIGLNGKALNEIKHNNRMVLYGVLLRNSKEILVFNVGIGMARNLKSSFKLNGYKINKPIQIRSNIKRDAYKINLTKYIRAYIRSDNYKINTTTKVRGIRKSDNYKINAPSKLRGGLIYE